MTISGGSVFASRKWEVDQTTKSQGNPVRFVAEAGYQIPGSDKNGLGVQTSVFSREEGEKRICGFRLVAISRSEFRPASTDVRENASERRKPGRSQWVINYCVEFCAPGGAEVWRRMWVRILARVNDEGTREALGEGLKMKPQDPLGTFSGTVLIGNIIWIPSGICLLGISHQE